MTILTSANGSLPLTLRKGETLVIRNYYGAETVAGSTAAREDVSSTSGAGAIAYGPQTSAASLVLSSSGSLDYQVVSGDVTPAVDVRADIPTGQLITPSGEVVGGGVARVSILEGATSGTSTAWLPLAAYPERLAYALDTGSATTTFSIDISADGVTSLGQAFTGTWASTTAEITPPLLFSNPQARYFRFNVITGGPLSVSRGY